MLFLHNNSKSIFMCFVNIQKALLLELINFAEVN